MEGWWPSRRVVTLPIMHVQEITLPRYASLDEAMRMLLALVRHRLGVDLTGLLNRRGWEHQIAKLGPDAQGSIVLFRGLTLGSASQRLGRIVRAAASAQPPVSFCAGVAATSASADASQALVAADRQLVARKRRRLGSEALSA